MPRITVVGFQVEIGLSQSRYLVFLRSGTTINTGSMDLATPLMEGPREIQQFTHTAHASRPFFFLMYKAISEALHSLLTSRMMKLFV